MIYTLTINPSLDLVMDLSAPLSLGAVNRTVHEEYNVGGKGINVATVLNNLGIEVIPVTVLSGFAGGEIENYLKKNFREYRTLWVEGELTRFTINIRGQEGETGFHGNGPDLTEDVLDRIIELLGEMKSGDLLCVSGSVPASLGEHAYEKIVSAFADKNIEIVIDASRNQLLNTLKYHPLLIKPNQKELGDYFHVRLTDKDECMPYLHKLQEMGARNVLCSLGSDGAVLLTEDGKLYYQKAPEGKLVNSVGAGDSMVAGFVYEYVNSHDYEKALKMGVACGSASAFSMRLATKKEIYDLL